MLALGVLLGVALALAVGYPAVRAMLRRQSVRARLAERKARDAQRMAEIGAMTGGLAHEIKNPLSTIGLNAQLLGEAVGELEIEEREKGRLQKRIEALRREVDRLRDILQDFLKFAGGVRVEPKPVDLNLVVEELADFYMPQAAHHGVRLRTELAASPRPLTAMIDPPHFKQALLNLMINATQAMEDRGVPASGAAAARPKELILRTGIAEPNRGEHVAGAGMAEVHVIDTGPGIPEDVLPRLFTPYFTTKSGGSGLGLPTAKRLIDEHSGTIEVHSKVGAGTDFVIRVPRAV